MESYLTCPQCTKETSYLNVEKAQYGRCDDCKVYWLIGENLFSSWRAETEDAWTRNAQHLKDYTEIKY